jgi:NTE family protein
MSENGHSAAASETLPNDGSLALALGGGAAKGLAHIPVLEALDDLGIKPRKIAGTSMGAIIGACYASGMSGRDLRAFAIELFEERLELIRRVFTEAESWSSIFSISSPAIIAPETVFSAVLPDTLPETFEELDIPLCVVATDFHAQSQVVIDKGALMPAVGASSALPVLLTPVQIDGRVLIDGGFVNPTAFDIIRGAAQFTVAVDVTGKQMQADTSVPGSLDTWIGASQIVLHSLVAEKLKHEVPDLLLRPDISAFHSFDFYKIEEILAASEPIKDEVKRGVERLLARAP